MFSSFRTFHKILFEAARIKKMPYYAVAKGRKVGVFTSWQECEQQIFKYSGAKYKKFNTKDKAEEFINDNSERKENKTDYKNIKLDSDDEKVLELYSDDNSNQYQSLFNDSNDQLLVDSLNSVENENHPIRSAQRRKCGEVIPLPPENKRRKYDAILSIIYESIGIKKFGMYEFQVDKDDYVIAYTDGSCENNGKKNAAAGFGVYFGDNHPLNISKPVEGKPTNNCGEIQAAIYALNIAKDIGIDRILINTDSKFLISVSTKWIWNWVKNGWKLKSGDDIKNLDDIKKLYLFLRDKNLNIKWNYTKGHAGIKGNVMADTLAKQGAKAYKALHNVK